MGKKSYGIENYHNKAVAMNFIEISFGRLYQLYKRYSWIDPYYSVAFVYGVLIASSINFLIALIFYYTGNKLFEFNFFPNGVILFIFVELIFYFFYKNKERYTESIKNLPRGYSRKDYLIMGIVFLMFSTWFLGPIVYKMGSNIH